MNKIFSSQKSPRLKKVLRANSVGVFMGVKTPDHKGIIVTFAFLFLMTGNFNFIAP